MLGYERGERGICWGGKVRLLSAGEVNGRLLGAGGDNVRIGGEEKKQMETQVTNEQNLTTEKNQCNKTKNKNEKNKMYCIKNTITRDVFNLKKN